MTEPGDTWNCRDFGSYQMDTWLQDVYLVLVLTIMYACDVDMLMAQGEEVGCTQIPAQLTQQDI